MCKCCRGVGTLLVSILKCVTQLSPLYESHKYLYIYVYIDYVQCVYDLVSFSLVPLMLHRIHFDVDHHDDANYDGVMMEM